MTRSNLIIGALALATLPAGASTSQAATPYWCCINRGGSHPHVRKWVPSYHSGAAAAIRSMGFNRYRIR